MAVLYAFGFERVGVVLSDLYFVDPDPAQGQEGAERGVRLEVRMLARGVLSGSFYSAQPIIVDRPIWRVDLLETANTSLGTLDRVHHHPRFRGWEPCPREFVEELSANPFAWLAGRLSNLALVLEEAGLAPEEVDPCDIAALQRTVPEILDAAQRLLVQVRGRWISPPHNDEELMPARVGWL